jgi:Leucine-rich repeat (LRR) protein
LYDLYNSTNGVNWDWKIDPHEDKDGVPWQFETKENPCTSNWLGLYCKVVGGPTLGRFTVTKIELSTRNLQGQLPVSLATLQNLEKLEVTFNHLNGTIPAILGTLSQMQHLGLSSNNFSGTLPLSLGNLSAIKHFGFDNNDLTGTVPNLWNNVSHLEELLLSHNRFEGTITNGISTLSNLVLLYLNHNNFHGTIPASLGNLSQLAYFDLDSNTLAGTIPETFANLTRLRFLGLHNNMLVGTIPGFLGNMAQLQFLYLNNERFTGTIPDSLSRLSSLFFLHLQYNQLTGTIPASLSRLEKVQYLYLNDNNLIGTVPATLSQLKNIESLLLQNNALTGSLDGVFNHSVQADLRTVQLSNNAFSGELPHELFLLPELVTLVAVSTCFHGSLPAALCQAKSLETLVLDGLRSGPSCQKIIISGFNGRVRHSNTFRGKVPSCLFSFPRLNTLHLSGNSLSGALPTNITVSEHLLDLDLSHNTLTGPIPEAIQNKDWYNLDLSYNRFSGMMQEDFYAQARNLTFNLLFERVPVNFTELPSTAALSLSNNRLSGIIPQRAKQILNITILTANVFSCKYDKSDLPQHDDGERTYSCGSNAFDLPYVTWVVVVAILVATVFTIWYFREKLELSAHSTAVSEKSARWLGVLTPSTASTAQVAEKLVNVRYIAGVCAVIERASVLCLAFILLVLLPLYAGEAYYYGTHTRQYAYALSATFLSGVVPFALQLVSFAVLLLLLVAGAISVRPTLESDPSAVAEMKDSMPALPWSTRMERLLVRVAYFTINLIVVLGVNVAFVVVALYQSTVLLVLAQVLLSVFKVVWNLICSPYLIRWTSYRLSSTASQRGHTSTLFFSLQMFVSLFNNIAIPCFVVAVVDPNCFYNVFVPAQAETSHYLYAVCKVYGIQGCLKVVPQIATASYHPRFDYSYQCSSSFITYYAPTFVYMCFVSMFFSPAMQVASLALLRSLPEGSKLRALISAVIPPVLLPVTTSTSQPVKRRVFRPYFDANLLISTLVTYLGVMLTFGAVFPPLAVSLALSILTMSHFAKLKIGRLLCAAIDADRLSYLDIVEEECLGAGAVLKLRQALRFVVCFCCMFYTLFLFDALGNARGFAGAVWVIFVVPLTAPAVYIVANTYASVTRPPRASMETHCKDVGGAGTEMVDIPSSDVTGSSVLSALHESV